MPPTRQRDGAAVTDGASARGREDWVDAAKGIAILGVVLFHAVLVTADHDLAWRWRDGTDVLDTFRMPLFFLTAGLFAARVLAQPFRVLVRRRLARLLWLYLLWTAIWVLVWRVVPWPRPDTPAPTAAEVTLALVWPSTTTWFIYGLAVFLALTWLARPLPTPVLLGGALVVSVVAAQVDTGNTALDKMGTYYVFFAVAARLGERVRAAAPRIRGRHAGVLVPTYLVVGAAVTATGLVWAPGVRTLVGALGVVAGVAAAVVVARARSAAWLVALGRSTLAVYLLHSYPVLALAALLGAHRAALEPWAPLIPPLVAVVATLVALAVHRATRAVPGLYDLPSAVTRAIEPRRPERRPVAATG